MSETQKPAFDPARFKEQERAGFNLVADRYEDAMEAMTPVTNRMLALAQLQAGQRVLDVATGPGILARAIAGSEGAAIQVVGVDIAEEALNVARHRASQAGYDSLTFQVEDAENLSFENEVFDRIVCSMGLMHFPQPEKALTEMIRVLKPGGRLVAAVWGQAEQAPFIQVALATLARTFPPPKVERPSIFRFGQPEILAKLLGEAGFSQVQTEPVIINITVEDPEDYWKRFLGAAGITAVALAKQPPETLTRLETDSASDLAPYQAANGFDLSSVIMLVAGVK